VKELKTTLQETRRIMEAHEKEWHTRMDEELETIKNLRETCKRLRAEKSVLEVLYILFLSLLPVT
jgi:hypothetical protein